MQKIPAEQVSPHELALIDSESSAAFDRGVPPTSSSGVRRPVARPPPPADVAITYRISDAVVVTGLSRSTIYNAMKRGELQSRLVCGRRLIPSAALRQFLGEAAA